MTVSAPPASAQRVASRTWTALRLALAGLWLVAAATGYVVHERPATLDDLYASVAAGDVVSVQLVGGLPADAVSGSATQEVHWRAGGVPRVATVHVVRESSGGQVSVSSSDAVTTDDVASEIAARSSAVRVVQTGVHSGVSFTSGIFGWSVPSWVGAVMLGVWLISLVVLVAGPEPWRATRWAWFWLGGTPLGPLPFLLLSGPAPALPSPHHPARRMTGGWAFLLSLVLPHGASA